MDKSVELELRDSIEKMRDEMNQGFKELSVQLAKVTTRQNVGAGIFKFILTIAVAWVGGTFGGHWSR